MCDPGDGPADLQAEAGVMGERNGMTERRVLKVENGGFDAGRWFMDTVRMWPILLLVGGIAWRSEGTRSKVENFESHGPRVSTSKPQPVVLEAELAEFAARLNAQYMPRELVVALLESMAKDIKEIKADVKDIQKNGDTH